MASVPPVEAPMAMMRSVVRSCRGAATRAITASAESAWLASRSGSRLYTCAREAVFTFAISSSL